MEAISGDAVVEIVTTIFVLSTMFSMGLKLSITQLVGALRDRQLLTRSLVVNLVAVPLVASVFLRTVPVGPAYATGFLLLAVSPGAPFGPKFAEISDSDIAFASGLMAILCLLSVVTIPVSLVALAPGGVVVNAIAIGRMVLQIQIIPLLAGLALSFVYTSIGNRLHTPIQRLSDISFVGLIVLLLGVYHGEMWSLVGTGTLGLSAAAVMVSLALGYVFGGQSGNNGKCWRRRRPLETPRLRCSLRPPGFRIPTCSRSYSVFRSSASSGRESSRARGDNWRN